MLHPPHSSPFPYTTLFRSSEITIRAALRGVSQDRLARPRESQARGVDPERLNPPHLLEPRSEEHTSELQSRGQLVCRLLLAKKNLYVLTLYLFELIELLNT